ncbi:hypothetical protein P5763_19080 [Bacillus cereus]|nr:hypothetical protein [Bacillus thuringiensis]MDF9614153.1 hypothetical protein [Bacillus cereus]
MEDIEKMGFDKDCGLYAVLFRYNKKGNRKYQGYKEVKMVE